MIGGKYKSWELISRPLGKILASQDPLSLSNTRLTHFDSCQLPNIAFSDYLARMRKYTECSDSCYILAFIYIDRALQNNPSFVLSNYSIHRLFLAAIILAIKYLDDLYSRNIIYAKIGGVCLAEFNVLEAKMLKMIDYNLFVTPQLYFQYADELLLQSLKIEEEELQIKEEMKNYCDKGLKPLRQIGSTESIKTTFSFNEELES
jgi:hypothetical protein